jgi:hypothetical protein
MPQKQPPESTAVSLARAMRDSSMAAGAGMDFGASSAQAGKTRRAQARRKDCERRIANRTNAMFLQTEARFDELQRGGVHAIAQTRGLRPVVEDVAQMRIAAFAGNRRARHEEGCCRWSARR